MKKIIKIVLSVFMICVLTACGSSKPKFNPADYAGIYVVPSANEGMFGTFEFKEDMTAEAKTILGGEEFALRKGTWEVLEDGTFTMTLSEGEPFNYFGVTYNASAVDAEPITFEEGKFTWKTTTANLISQEEYDSKVETSKIFAPVKLASGDTVDQSVFSFTVKSFGYCDVIEPSDTSGYYTYYDKQSDATYVVCRISYTNKGSDFQGPIKASSYYFLVDGEKYDAKMEMDIGNNFSSIYGLDPNTTEQFIVWTAVWNKDINNIKNIELHWLLPTCQEDLETYFSASKPVKEYIITK